MFFVVDKSRLLLMIDIVREDRTEDKTGHNANGKWESAVLMGIGFISGTYVGMKYLKS